MGERNGGVLPSESESGEALPPVSPEDKYLNQIIYFIFVSSRDGGSRRRGWTLSDDEQRFLRSDALENTVTWC